MKKPPYNLNFLTMQFPITAWVSILHRLSGIWVFLFIPLALWMLQESVASEHRFLALKRYLQETLSVRILVWSILAALIYHLVAGIRHLLMDIQVGESLKAGRFSAKLVLLFSFILCVGLGFWILDIRS